MANQSKLKRKRSEQPATWKDAAEAMKLFQKDKNFVYVEVMDCVPGSNIRAVRQEEVFKLMKSMNKEGLLLTSIIHVVEPDPTDKKQGKYRVIDGMHRVTACQTLAAAGTKGFTQASLLNLACHSLTCCTPHVS